MSKSAVNEGFGEAVAGDLDGVEKCWCGGCCASGFPYLDVPKNLALCMWLGVVGEVRNGATCTTQSNHEATRVSVGQIIKGLGYISHFTSWV